MNNTIIKTKADAMAFAIDQAGVQHLDKAARIYRMFVDNMELPNEQTDAADRCFKKLEEATEALTRRIAARLSEDSEARPQAAPCYIGQSKIDEKARGTIILPGLPHLEWMTENLSGFGGTEVNGRWYYTYDEAVEAVKQLGDGWRLPTRGEMLDLDDLGSEWQENGPHGLPGRLFGGGLFIPATGYRNRETGALYNVGTGGYYYSSSPRLAADYGASYMGFHSTDVQPLIAGDGYRSFGLSVRCVRNVK